MRRCFSPTKPSLSMSSNMQYLFGFLTHPAQPLDVSNVSRTTHWELPPVPIVWHLYSLGHLHTEAAILPISNCLSFVSCHHLLVALRPNHPAHASVSELHRPRPMKHLLTLGSTLIYPTSQWNNPTDSYRTRISLLHTAAVELAREGLDVLWCTIHWMQFLLVERKLNIYNIHKRIVCERRYCIHSLYIFIFIPLFAFIIRLISDI